MSSSASSATWLPAAIARAAVVFPAPPAAGPRHLAPDTDDAVMHTVVAETQEAPPGRHAEPPWSRELFDPSRDEDPFVWLGFGADDA